VEDGAAVDDESGHVAVHATAGGDRGLELDSRDGVGEVRLLEPRDLVLAQ
jgi:hypothetical protein